MKVCISFYYKRITKRVSGKVWISWGKYIKVQNFFPSNRKSYKVTEINKNDNGSSVTISYKIKCINITWFKGISLSNIVDNLTERILKIKCKDRDCFLEFQNVKANSIKYRCLSCNKDYWNKIDEQLKKRFKNTSKFSNNDINKFILLLRKGFYPYKCMNDWEKFNEI